MSLSAAASFARLARALPTYAIIRRTARDIAAGRPSAYTRDVRYVEKGFWGKTRRMAGRVPFVLDLTAAWYCAVDRRTPVYVKAVLMGALAYFVVPVDIVPDIILGAGLVDDATVLATAISGIASHIKPDHIEKARRSLAFTSDTAQS